MDNNNPCNRLPLIGSQAASLAGLGRPDFQQTRLEADGSLWEVEVRHEGAVVGRAEGARKRALALASWFALRNLELLGRC